MSVGRPLTRGAALVAGALVLGGLLAACSGPSGSVQGRTSTPLLTFSTKHKTVHLELFAAATGDDNGFNFDGASSGAMTVTVPTGWRVDVSCFNYSTTLTHSCAIVKRGSTSLAFSGAAVPDPTQGLQPGRSANFSFEASSAGRYRIVCLVPGHLDAGMWDHFVVRSEAQPTIKGHTVIPSRSGGSTGA